jgi:hypothetical protein
VNYIPFSMIKAIHEQTHSAFPNAPIVPHVPHRPRRHPIRAVRRLLQSRGTAPVAPVVEPMVEPMVERPTLALASGTDHELCEAELRDRGTKVAGAARAC